MRRRARSTGQSALVFGLVIAIAAEKLASGNRARNMRRAERSTKRGVRSRRDRTLGHLDRPRQLPLQPPLRHPKESDACALERHARPVDVRQKKQLDQPYDAAESRLERRGLYGKVLGFTRARRIVGIFGSCAAISFGSYYLIWRFTTISGTGLFGSIFYVVEIVNFLALALFALLLTRMRFRSTSPPERPEGAVDVFIPVCGESVGMVEQTLRAALSMWHSDQVYLLNDGRIACRRNWRAIERLAQHSGVRCLTRTSGIRGKAGNLNNALQQTSGDFIVVIDADHEARPFFIEDTLRYFSDANVAFVATPQQFAIRGRDRLNNQELLFYRSIMPAKDAGNAAFSCGNGVVYRRRALQDVGGFSNWSIVEDVHTSYRLHSKGWKSVYHPHALTMGTAPETGPSLLKQRLTWATDSLRIFFWDSPLWRRGLTVWQRLHYLQTTTFPLVGATHVLFILTPALYLLWHTPIMRLHSVSSYLAHALPYFGSCLLLLVAYGGLRGGLRAAQHNLMLSPVYAIAVLKALTKRRYYSGATNKGPSERPSLLIAPYVLLLVLVIASLTVAIQRRDFSAGATLAAAWAAWGGTALASAMTAARSSWIGARLVARTSRVTIVVAAAAIAFLASPILRERSAAQTSAGSAAQTSARASLAPPERGSYIGVYDPSLLRNSAGVRSWNKRYETGFHLVAWYQQWGSGERRFRPDWAANVAKQGGVPVISWEPWSKPVGGVVDPYQAKYRVAAIAAGRYDDYIRSWARGAAAYGGPLMIRFMHEMNGTWYPWSLTATGENANDFIRAWRRAHRIFEAEGATNVSWIWAINVFYDGMPAANQNLDRYYPGDEYVDWVAMSGYNWGTSSPFSHWRYVDEIFRPTYRAVLHFRKPVLIAEIATVTLGGNATRWVSRTLTGLRLRYPQVKAVIWFDADYPGTADFRMEEDQRRAFAGAVGRSSYWKQPLRRISLPEHISLPERREFNE